MGHRTAGIVLTCVFFLFSGVTGFFGGIMLIGPMLRIFSNLIEDVSTAFAMFMLAIPFYTLALGLAAFFVAYWLWVGNPNGPRRGIVWIGLWLFSEVATMAVIVWGPEIAQEAGSISVGSFLRVALGILLVYYLWTKMDAGSGTTHQFGVSE